MLVREYMTSTPMTVAEDASLIEAAELMKEKKIRRFPVLRGDRLIGIVTDRDLRSAAPSQVVSFDVQERQLMPELHSLLANIKIKDVMSHDVVTIDPEQTIVAAAQLMLNHRVSGLPVVGSQGQLVGIITETDIFGVLVDLCGASSGSTTLAFQLEDRPGSIKEVTDIMRARGARPASVLASPVQADARFRRVYIRIRDFPSEKLQALEEELRQQFEILYVTQDDVSAS